MPITPGRPHEATLHPRTRGEANEFAIKNRSTGDWFRHDGKNIEVAPPPPTRLPEKRAGEYAAKNKGEPEQWFQQGTKAAPATDVTSEHKGHSKAAQQNMDKVAGTEEHWFKHEENQDYHSARPKERLSDFSAAPDIKKKQNQQDSNEWYKYDPTKGGSAPDKAQQGSPSRGVDKQRKVFAQSSPGTPDWFSHEHKGAASNGHEALAASVEKGDADNYLERNRQGSAASWYSHHATNEVGTDCLSPRVASSEGGEIATRLGKESENWFDHAANKSYNDPRPGTKGSSTAARDQVERAHGGEMNHIIHMDPVIDASKVQTRVKPEATDIAKKNVDGMMEKYMRQEQNKNYNSPRPAPRIKPEAQETFDKNQGVMEDCMGGYPAPPPDKYTQPRVKREAEDIALKNKGNADKVITGDLPASGRKANRNKPEAEEYAQRNQGTLKHMMDNYGHMDISGRPASRLQTQEAEDIAQKYKGAGVADVFSMK